jgi:hypothetical protein
MADRWNGASCFASCFVVMRRVALNGDEGEIEGGSMNLSREYVRPWGLIRNRGCSLILLLSALVTTMVSAQSVAQAPVAPRTSLSPAQQKAQQMFSALPLLFEPIPEQNDSKPNFLSREQDYTLFLTAQYATFVRNGEKSQTSSLHFHWVNSNPSATLSGEQEIAGKTNYLIGNRPSNWQTGIANYQQVKEDELYPGVDLLYYGNHNQLEYDLRLASGADPANIRMKIEGARAVHLDKVSGDLVIFDGKNELRLHKPVAYQQEQSQSRHEVAASYVLSAQNTVSFHLGDYDRTRPLVIDPYVVYSTLYAGTQTGVSNSVADEIFGMAVDSQGDVYLQGITTAINIPTTSGAFQPACNLGEDNECKSFWVAKFDPTQSGAASLIYATYIGGHGLVVGIGESTSLAYAQPNDLAVDSSGDAYFSGYSTAPDYPTTPSAYQASSTVGGGFVTELNPTGTGLAYSTFITTTGVQVESNNANIAEGTMVAVDSAGKVYVGGVASGLTTTDGSSCSIEFCMAAFLAAYDTTQSGTASLVYAKYIPMGSLAAIAADSSGNVYLGGQLDIGANNGTVSGWTTQSLPLNGFQTTSTATGSDQSEPYFVRLDSTGAGTYGTFTGNLVNGLEQADSISVDNNGVATIGGLTSLPFTLVNPIIPAPTTTHGTGFIAEIDTTQTGANSLLYSTFIPTNNSDYVYIYSVANNSTGKIIFCGLGQLASDITQIDPLTEPASTSLAFIGKGFIGQLDPTQTGDNELDFMSLISGVQIPFFVSYDPSGNFIVGGTSYIDEPEAPFIATSGSFETSDTAESDPPFFYKISLASSAASSLTVSPSSLTFSSQIVNTTSAAQTITVQNSGSSAITFTSIVASASFTETDDCSPSLAANSSCTIDVTFTPTATGAITGTLTLTDSDPSSPQTVSLSGTGAAGSPQALLAPASLPFGNQTAGTTSAAQVVELSNPGTATLTNIAVSITGAGANAFADTSACGTMLNAGASCDISVTFSPTATGSFTAQLSVSDSAAGAPQTVALSGTGIAPAAPVAQVTPSSLNFGSVVSGSTSAVQAVTVTNTGNAALTINSIAIAGTNPSDFAETNTCGVTLSSGASCTVSVSFTPASAAGFSATLSIADNAAGSPQTVALSGTGTAPTTPSDFAVSSTTPAQTVQPGAAANFTIDVAPVNGTFNNAVALTATGLPPGASASFAPGNVTPGNAGSTSVLTVQSAQLVASTTPWTDTGRSGTSLLSGVLLPLLLLWRKRKGHRKSPLSQRLPALVLALGALATLSGCGGGYFGAKPQTYTITVTGTSGATQHSTTVTLTVE